MTTQDPGHGDESVLWWHPDDRDSGQPYQLVILTLEERRLVLDCGESDLPRVRELVGRYDDLPLGLTDAAVVACAERHGGRVLTLDRDFSVVAGEGSLTVVP